MYNRRKSIKLNIKLVLFCCTFQLYSYKVQVRYYSINIVQTVYIQSGKINHQNLLLVVSFVGFDRTWGQIGGGGG